MSKGNVVLIIPIISRVITIWDEVFFKLIFLWTGKVFLDSIHGIKTHLDLVVEVIEVQISVAFGFCLDEEFIELF